MFDALYCETNNFPVNLPSRYTTTLSVNNWYERIVRFHPGCVKSEGHDLLVKFWFLKNMQDTTVMLFSTDSYATLSFCGCLTPNIPWGMTNFRLAVA